MDYPLFIRPVAEAVARGEFERGIVLGGSGNGDQSLPDTAPGVYENSDGRSFSEWLQIGLALSLPLILFGVIAIALFVWMNSR